MVLGAEPAFFGYSWADDSYPHLKYVFFLPELKHTRVENI